MSEIYLHKFRTSHLNFFLQWMGLPILYGYLTRSLISTLPREILSDPSSNICLEKWAFDSRRLDSTLSLSRRSDARHAVIGCSVQTAVVQASSNRRQDETKSHQCSAQTEACARVQIGLRDFGPRYILLHASAKSEASTEALASTSVDGGVVLHARFGVPTTPARSRLLPPPLRMGSELMTSNSARESPSQLMV